MRFRNSPEASRHIRRIQAVYALIDYLGLNGPDGRSRGHTWGDLAGQHLRRADWDQRRTFLIRRLVAMLEREADSEALANHLAQALQLPPEDIAPLLWEHPNRISKTTGCGTRLSPSLAWAIVRRFEHAGSPDREKRPPDSMC